MLSYPILSIYAKTAKTNSPKLKGEVGERAEENPNNPQAVWAYHAYAVSFIYARYSKRL